MLLTAVSPLERQFSRSTIDKRTRLIDGESSPRDEVLKLQGPDHHAHRPQHRFRHHPRARILFFLRVRHEEELMIEAFGEEYRRIHGANVTDPAGNFIESESIVRFRRGPSCGTRASGTIEIDLVADG
jgi:hypothetical protein